MPNDTNYRLLKVERKDPKINLFIVELVLGFGRFVLGSLLHPSIHSSVHQDLIATILRASSPPPPTLDWTVDHGQSHPGKSRGLILLVD